MVTQFIYHARAYEREKGYKFIPVKILRKISIISDVIAVYKLMMIIRKERVSVVVGHTPKGALLSMLTSWIMRVPVRIYFRHGLVYETMNGLSRWIMIILDRLTSFCSTKIVCVSPSLFKRSLEDELSMESKQVILNKENLKMSQLENLNYLLMKKLIIYQVIKIIFYL